MQREALYVFHIVFKSTSPFIYISTMYVVGELNDFVDVTSVKLELYKIKDNDSLDKLIF